MATVLPYNCKLQTRPDSMYVCAGGAEAGIHISTCLFLGVVFIFIIDGDFYQLKR